MLGRKSLTYAAYYNWANRQGYKAYQSKNIKTGLLHDSRYVSDNAANDQSLTRPVWKYLRIPKHGAKYLFVEM